MQRKIDETRFHSGLADKFDSEIIVKADFVLNSTTDRRFCSTFILRIDFDEDNFNVKFEDFKSLIFIL